MFVPALAALAFSSAALAQNHGSSFSFERSWGAVNSEGLPALPGREYKLDWCAAPLLGGECPANAAMMSVQIVETHLFSLENDVALFRYWGANVRDERKGQCANHLGYNIVNQLTQNTFTKTATDQWGNKITLDVSGLDRAQNQTCYQISATVIDKNGIQVVPKTSVLAPTIVGLPGACAGGAGRKLLSVDDSFEADAVMERHARHHPLRDSPRSKVRHSHGDQTLAESRRAAALARARARAAAAASFPSSSSPSSMEHSEAGSRSLSAAEASVFAAANYDAHFGAVAVVANSTDNGYAFDGCVLHNSTLLIYQRCTYSWYTCSAHVNGTIPAGCEKWSESIVSLAEKDSDRRLMHIDVFQGIENSAAQYCEIWRGFKDIVSEVTYTKSSIANTKPDPLTGYTSNITFSALWGNGPIPCVCSSLSVKAVITGPVNETLTIYPQSPEYCNPDNCAPWPSSSPSVVPVPPSPSPEPKKKSQGTKIAIAAAVGGGALLLGSGAAIMFFRKKPDSASSGLMSGGKGDSYSAISDKN